MTSFRVVCWREMNRRGLYADGICSDAWSYQNSTRLVDGHFAIDLLKGRAAGWDGVNGAMMMAGIVGESQCVRFSSY